MDDRLRVAVGLEDVAGAFEVAAQLPVVVDLAVEDDPDRAVLVRDRLLAAFEIDDAEAPHAERDAFADVDAFLIGAAVHDGPAHPADLLLEDRRAVPPHDTGNATHGYFSPCEDATERVDRATRRIDSGRPSPGMRPASRRRRSMIGRRIAAGSATPGA